MAQYYLSVNGQQQGPFEVNQLIPNGLNSDSMVWTNGMANWMRAAEVPELAYLFASPAPAPQMAMPQPVQQARGPIVDKVKVDSFMMAHKDYFPADKIPMIKDRLSMLDEGAFDMVANMKFKNPVLALVLSFFAGVYGVDRYYLEQTGMFIGKLLTCGGCGIWTIIDWFMIMDATREKNFEIISPYI